MEQKTVENSDINLEIVTKDGLNVYKIKVDNGDNEFVFIPVPVRNLSEYTQSN